MPDEKGGEYWGEMVVRRLKELEEECVKLRAQVQAHERTLSRLPARAFDHPRRGRTENLLASQSWIAPDPFDDPAG